MAEGVRAVAAAALDPGGVERGAPGIAVEVVAVDRLVLPRGGDQVITRCGVPAEVLGHLNGDGVRERDGAGLAALGLVDRDAPAEQLDLLLDV